MSREIKDSGIEWIGDIPKGWEVKRAKSIFAQRSSKGNATAILLSATQKQGMLPQSMLEGVVQTNANTDLQTFKTVHKNDYVISLRSFQGGFEMSNYEGVCSPAYQVFYNKVPISHKFFWSLFKSYGFIDKINSLTVGIREGKNIQYKDFANMMLAVPSFSEQQKIADYLDKVCGEIDSMITLQEKMIEELKAYKQSVITEAVTKGLNPNVPMKDSGIDWIGDIPVEWKISLLFSLFVEHKHKNEGLKETNLLSLSYGSIIRKDINTNEGLLPHSFDSYNVIDIGDIVFRLTDLQNDKKSLRTGLCKEKGIITSAYTTIRKKSKQIHSGFMHYLFHSYDICKVFYGLGGGVRQGMNYGDLKKIAVVYPSLQEQRAIADYLDTKCSEIDSLIALKQTKIEELKDYKKSLIYEYVTGKKQVN